MRYTEYHGGVAVIKDKSKHKEAMEKLAKVEDLEEKNADIDQITTEMMEYICDNLCKHPNRVGITQDELDGICAECKMGKFVCDILNTYNRQNSCEGCQNAECTKQLLPCRTCMRDKEDHYVRREI